MTELGLGNLPGEQLSRLSTLTHTFPRERTESVEGRKREKVLTTKTKSHYQSRTDAAELCPKPL